MGLYLNTKVLQPVSTTCGTGSLFGGLVVVYFDQQMGAPHVICSVSDGKSCSSVSKSILNSEWLAEHLFTGRNTQQSVEGAKFLWCQRLCKQLWGVKKFENMFLRNRPEICQEIVLRLLMTFDGIVGHYGFGLN